MYGPYSTLADIYLEIHEPDLARLTGDSNGVVVDMERVHHAIQMADAVVDSYLYGRYEVPFEVPIDPTITKVSVDLAMANLYDYAYADSGIPNTIVWRRINALRFLKDLQEGKATLRFTNPTLNASPPIISNKSLEDRYFSDDLLDNFSE